MEPQGLKHLFERIFIAGRSGIDSNFDILTRFRFVVNVEEM